MEKKEILEKAQNKKDLVGEMERTKTNKSCFISLLVAGIIAVAFMVVEGIFGHFTAIYAIFCCKTTMADFDWRSA